MSQPTRDEGPRRIGASLDSLSRTMGLGGSVGLGRLFSGWEQIVGAAMADHVRPVRIDDQALVVSVDHPAWATQVSLLGDDLLDRVAAVAAIRRPERLEVRVRR